MSPPLAYRPRTGPPHPSRVSWPARLVVGVVVANIVLAVVLILALNHTRAQHERRVRTDAQNLTDLLARNIAASFDRVDHSLHLLTRTLPAPIAQAERSAVREQLSGHLATLADVKSLQVFDAQGSLVSATNLASDAKLEVRGHPVFEGLRNAPAGQTRVFKAVRSVVDGEWVVVLGRNIQGPGGDTLGVVSAALSLNHFARLFDSVDLRARGEVTLRDAEQGLVVQQPAHASTRADVGDQRLPEAAKKALAEHPEAGSYVTHVADGGAADLERLYVYRRVPRYPFHVAVGLPTDDLMGDWRNEVAISAFLYGAFALLTIGLAALLARLWRRRERQMAELLALAEEGRAQFERLFQVSPVATVIMRVADWRIVDANDAFCKRYGVTREVAIGQTSAALGIGPGATDRRVFAQRVVHDRQVRNQLSRVTLRSGESRDGLINGELIEYRGEACVLASQLDITELRQSERAREAQAVAEAANDAKTAFLTRMSHELRTPLNAVIGFTQLLRADAAPRLTPEQRIQLDHVHQAGWFLLTLTNDVLELSRIEAGQLAVSVQPVLLAPLVDDALHLTQPLARRLGVSLGPTELAEDLAVLADPVRLRQVLLNLLSNAVKYNREGGKVWVDVGVAAGQVRLAVVDTGLGMTPEQLAQLFEPFNRLGRERSGVEGSGIGLVLSRQLVQLMKGELTIESDAAAGTRACVTLPAASIRGGPSTTRPADRAPAASQAPAPDGALGDGPSPIGSVLYIEDNPVNSMLVEQLLARWPGVRFLHAPSGREGVRQARAELPDLVLLDMQLGDMDGPEVLRALRAEPSTAGLHVVVLSANAMSEDMARMQQAGVDGYWTKPIDAQQFLNGVRGVLAKRSTQAK